MEYRQLVRERYSVRKFSDQPVEDSKVAAILEVARLAPTAVNKQPVRIVVLNSPAAMDRLKTCTPYAFNAPMALVVCAKPDEAWVRPYDRSNSAAIDAAIVGTHIMLAIHDLGLGATWVGHFDPAALSEACNLPAGIVPIALFPTGYPDAAPAPQHDKRRPLTELAVYNKF